MSMKTRQQTEVHPSRSVRRKVEQELQEGYVEVEVTGLTLHRLAACYAVLAKSAWGATLDGVRSFLRPNHAL